MAVTRRVHKIHATADATYVVATPTSQGGWFGASQLEIAMNKMITNGERIVGTHRIDDSSWVIITEDLGLGPMKPR